MDVESRDHAAPPASPGAAACLLQAFINYLLSASTLTSIPSINRERGGGRGEVLESISQHAEVKAELLESSPGERQEPERGIRGEKERTTSPTIPPLDSHNLMEVKLRVEGPVDLDLLAHSSRNSCLIF